MTQARRNSIRKRGKAALALGAAGVSLAMTGAASATAPTTNEPSQDNARRFILGEEEISDVSLATFQVFDRENPPLSQGIRVARGGGGCAGAVMAAGAVGALMPAVAAADALMRRRRLRRWWPLRCRWRRCWWRVRGWWPLRRRWSLRSWWPLRLQRRLRLQWRMDRSSGAWVAPAAPEPAGNGTRTWASGSASAIKPNDELKSSSGAAHYPRRPYGRDTVNERDVIPSLHGLPAILTFAHYHTPAQTGHVVRHGNSRC